MMFELEDVKQFLIENGVLKENDLGIVFGKDLIVDTYPEELIDLIANFTLIQIEKEREKILKSLRNE